VHSVKEHGILEPLLVRSLPDGTSELIAGERRLRAAIEAGLTEVPVISKELTDKQALSIALIENLQREDLNPLEETEGILELLALRLELNRQNAIAHLTKMRNVCDRDSELRHNVMSQPQTQIVEELFTSLGRMSWESFVKNRLPLLNLPSDVLEALRIGKIEYTKARAIAQIKDEYERGELLKSAIKNGLSLEEIKVLVKQHQAPNSKPPLKSEYKELSKKLGTSKVWENPKKLYVLEKLLNQIKSLLDEE
jgi:ParB family transcriptional regulator, chromosome partitioning protein